MVPLPVQMGLQRWWEQEIPVDGTINKGELMTHNLTELIKPESYEVRLTPITRFGEGDSTIRIVTYSGECCIVTLVMTFCSQSDSDQYLSCSMLMFSGLENRENQIHFSLLLTHVVAQVRELQLQLVMLSFS